MQGYPEGSAKFRREGRIAGRSRAQIVVYMDHGQTASEIHRAAREEKQQGDGIGPAGDA
jgi:hypothetical protein